jgi:hypothetical protein
MKPGDLVQVLGLINNLPPKMGLIVGQKVVWSSTDWSSTRFPVLIDGELMYIPEFELQLLEVIDETG